MPRSRTAADMRRNEQRRTGNPTGRPHGLDEVVRLRDNGQPVTAEQHVLERIALGVGIRAASSGAGIASTTVNLWRRNGALARARAARGDTLTERDRRYADFLNRYEDAQAQVELHHRALIRRIADGGFERTRTVIKQQLDEHGGMVEVERTVTTEVAEPNWQASAWVLARTMPEKYARRMEVSVVEPDDDDTAEEQSRQLADDLRAYLQGRADAEAEAQQ